MSWNFDDIQVCGQLRVGTGIVAAIKEGDEKINGSMHSEGPVVFGKPDAFDDNVATLMVGRTNNDDKDCVPADRSLYTKGNVLIEGDKGTSNALKITGSQSYQLYVEGNAFFDHPNIGDLSKRFTTADQKPKPFDMVHPSRGEGSRLRYACIEGPQVGVYCRGRVKNDTEIVLPNYWRDLVHVDSISVQLQPIGAHQDIIVKRWDEEKIYLQAKAGFPINCFYHVYAERKDINPLIVEYKGDSWEDYPDPNFNPNKVPDNEKTYNDPRFAGPPNTITT